MVTNIQSKIETCFPSISLVFYILLTTIPKLFYLQQKQAEVFLGTMEGVAKFCLKNVVMIKGMNESVNECFFGLQVTKSKHM